MPRFGFLTLLLLILLALAPAPASASLFTRLLPSSDIQPLVASRTVDGARLADPQGLAIFYESRGNRPVWSASAAHGLLGLLDDSWTEGLNPANYHTQALHGFFDDRRAYQGHAAEADILLSDAVMRYGHDVTGMRINPANDNQNPVYWRQPQNGAGLLGEIAKAPDPAKALAALSPQDALYQMLRREMKQLEQGQDDAATVVPRRATFKPGQSDPAVPALRARFGTAAPADERLANLYDDALAASVKSFQQQHNLEPDGIIGGKTLQLLNRSRRDRMLQIVVNLERLRWLDQNRPGRYVLVNIPSETLWAVENGKIVFDMPVIVGKPERPTPTFKTLITGIRFNPTWTAPKTIKMQDIVPVLQQDPHGLDEKGIQYFVNGQMVDPASIDWKNITPEQLAQVHMIEKAGDDNSLGRVRVLMPDEYDVYLHDTNQRELFDRHERNLSSGCVRMSRPLDMARFVLEHKPGWSDARMNAILDSGRTVEIQAPEKMPVYLVYQTVWPDQAGKLVYGRDIYGEDAKLLRILTDMNAYALPEQARS